MTPEVASALEQYLDAVDAYAASVTKVIEMLESWCKEEQKGGQP